jgi:hypothetical protein
MNNLARHLVPATALVALVGIGSIMSSRAATAQNPNPGSAPVNIVGPLPLPVAGSVAATQSGTWNVNLAGASSTDPLLVRDVDGPNRQPFQRSFSIPYGQSGCGQNFCVLDLGTVPNGKFLVLTHFQGEVAYATGNTPLNVSLLKTASGTGSRVFNVPRASLVCFTDTLSITRPNRCPFNEEIRVIYNAGESARIDTDTSGSFDSNVRQSFVVSGYYVNAPPSLTPLLRQNFQTTSDQQSFGATRREPEASR